jgi:hypothetical protein
VSTEVQRLRGKPEVFLQKGITYVIELELELPRESIHESQQGIRVEKAQTVTIH